MSRDGSFRIICPSVPLIFLPPEFEGPLEFSWEYMFPWSIFIAFYVMHYLSFKYTNMLPFAF